MNQLMEDSKCDAASSSSTVAQSSACECVQPVATILRIRRKRTADPHDALIVSLKKSRKADKTSDDGITSLLYSLAGTSTTPEVKDIGGVPHQNANIIDFDAHQINGKQVDDVEMLKCSESDKENSGGDKLTETVADQQQYLSKFCDAIDEGGTSAQSRNSQSNLQFTLNGIPMMSVKTSELPIEADYVFDFYWNPTVVACNPDEMEVRIANANDIELYMGGDEESESNANADDEDDSNDENNWRNDYPDEEEHDSEDSDEEHDSDFDDLNEKFDDMDFYGQGVGSSGDEDDDDDDNEKND